MPAVLNYTTLPHYQSSITSVDDIITLVPSYVRTIIFIATIMIVVQIVLDITWWSEAESMVHGANNFKCQKQTSKICKTFK